MKTKIGFYAPIKRVLDVVASVSLLILTAPVQLIVAIAVYSQMGSPVLFGQTRPGLHGKPFTILKFRTMEALGPGSLGENSMERVTPLGKFLRFTSLDELPSLWNVLKGDMSMVGPRPLLMEYLPLYTPEQARRHEVRPGITGLAQVSGRNTLQWPDRFALDVDYVSRASLILDAWIVMKTIAIVFRKEGILPDPNAPVSKFSRTLPDASQSSGTSPWN
jgi:lipopolysaccharide/colanic/teichoic acid biosynthesis glycosyltransferase